MNMLNDYKIQSNYDVIIVGAGPSGCSVAKFLSKNYKILLIDQSKFPRNKACGGLLVEETQNFIKDNKISVPKTLFSYPKLLDLKLLDWNNNLELNQKRNFWNVSRLSFDRWLLNISETNFSPETKLLNFENKKNCINILFRKKGKKKIIKTKYLVGGDGALSVIRDEIKKNRVKKYLALQEWIIPNKNIYNYTYFIYDNDITDFYSWIIPKRNYVIIGSALQDKEKFQVFKSKLKQNLDFYGDILKREAAILSRPMSKKNIFLGKGNILLTGESSGMISPSTGEGISFAMRSGFNCAAAISNNFRNALNEYKVLCKPLIKEIEEKIKKAEIFSNPLKRMKIFKD